MYTHICICIYVYTQVLFVPDSGLTHILGIMELNGGRPLCERFENHFTKQRPAKGNPLSDKPGLDLGFYTRGCFPKVNL